MRAVRTAAFFLLLPGWLSATAAPLELRPNLRVLPASDITIEPDVLGRPMLRFTTKTWNSGVGPVEIAAGETGTDRKGSYRQNVYQRVYLDDGTYYERLAGAFVWHPDHHHFHMDDYALYTLQPIGAKGKSKVSGSKTSFCLMDTEQIDGGLAGAPPSPVYGGCDNAFQGISVGWGDAYGAHLPGQNLDLSGLPSGDYALSFAVDPKGRLVETDDNDNTSCVALRIDVPAQSVVVLNPLGCGGSAPPPGSDAVVQSISPDSGSKGSIVPVTILGANFTAAVSVSFEGGAGAAPVVSDVVVVNASTITATVTIRRNATVGSAWDLRVQTSVLPSAFTVLP